MDHILTIVDSTTLIVKLGLSISRKTTSPIIILKKHIYISNLGEFMVSKFSNMIIFIYKLSHRVDLVIQRMHKLILKGNPKCI